MGLVLLARHAMTDAVGTRLTGRAPGVPLNAAGLLEARALAQRLSEIELSAIWSSPLERARETARIVAERAGLDVVLRPGLDELDFGDWTNLSFDELRAREDWLAFNRRRTAGAPPGGEALPQVQRRMLAEVEAACALHGDGSVLLVSHGDPLRALLCHYLHTPLDELDRFELSPASVSLIDTRRHVVLGLNYCGALLPGDRSSVFR